MFSVAAVAVTEREGSASATAGQPGGGGADPSAPGRNRWRVTRRRSHRSRRSWPRARWELARDCLLRSLRTGTVINLYNCWPGQLATAFGAFPVMTFVEDEFQVIALFGQNELHQVAAGRGNGQRFALDTYPGPDHQSQRRLRSMSGPMCGQGQIAMSGCDVPQTGPMPADPRAFRSTPARRRARQRHLFLAAGAVRVMGSQLYRALATDP